jgi:hypothetical protein
MSEEVYDSVGEPIFNVYCHECCKRKKVFEYEGYYLCEKCLKKAKENKK